MLSGTLRIGVIEGLDFIRKIQPLIARWEAEYPNVQLVFERQPLEKLNHDLLAGSYDLCIQLYILACATPGLKWEIIDRKTGYSSTPPRTRWPSATTWSRRTFSRTPSMCWTPTAAASPGRRTFNTVNLWALPPSSSLCPTTTPFSTPSAPGGASACFTPGAGM